jgi:hypothetical protein
LTAADPIPPVAPAIRITPLFANGITL